MLSKNKQQDKIKVIKDSGVLKHMNSQSSISNKKTHNKNKSKKVQLKITTQNNNK